MQERKPKTKLRKGTLAVIATAFTLFKTNNMIKKGFYSSRKYILKLNKNKTN